MSTQHVSPDRGAGGRDARRRALAGLPVRERRLRLAGVRTAVVEGGDGPPVVLLHGPAGNATHWMRVIPDLATTHRVVVPDLPGQGASRLLEDRLDVPRVVAWLDELIGQLCATPPVLVGYALGGAIAARFAADHADRVRRLVLVDTLGLVPFQPTPEFGGALHRFLAQPAPETHDHLWRYCAADLDRLRARMGEQWEAFRAYNLDLVARPEVMAALGALMDQFAAPIPEAELARISVPTDLIWGRHDLATPLRVAEAASARHGWPLHVIEGCADDPPVERPEAFVRTLRAILHPSTERVVAPTPAGGAR